MAEVYSYVNGMKIEKAMAVQRDVQRELDALAKVATGLARANLAAHRDTGNANVHMEKGRVDRYVYLEDLDVFEWDEDDNVTRYKPGASAAIEINLQILGEAFGMQFLHGEVDHD